ncbi:hypothetical protein I6A60_00480 [Frankia sp. AgB1.9]|uniref:hypothetical protein n=1 Tax=unclassified Frankia TaxID=2632575 RepID=UPI00193356AF|nr:MULTISPECIES: hypothetical protein [unclassified Frankia]MBL7487356.1 hypothetical protein [Frankia sp. AgW1.1]MBL7546364.1 hypothetical protein [Frankia sp. AgB1.9]MBL7618591.1 hypothetical protein [Frankia sp. AgB1.8]
MTATSNVQRRPARQPMVFSRRELTPPPGLLARWRARMAEAKDEKEVDALAGGVVGVGLLAAYLQTGKQKEAARELRRLLAVEQAAFERTLQLSDARPVYSGDPWAEAT